MMALIPFAIFFAAAGVTIWAGVILARSGDVLAARTRLGGAWIGLIFLAFATSLPELGTSVSAVRIGQADLAAGDLFGSSMVNMLILALVGLLPGTALFRRAALDNVLSASLAIILTAVAAAGVILRAPAVLAGIGPGSLLLVAIYLVGTRALFRQSALAREAGATIETTDEAPPTGDAADSRSLRRVVAYFLAASAAILFAAPLLAASAAQISVVTGIGASFIGTWLVGLATSLPELSSSLAAVRLRSYDLAMGNLFGSNAVNMAMFAALDLAHPAGPILASVGYVHVLTALAATVMMGIALAALIYRVRGRFTLLEPSSLLMILVYFAGLALVYLRS